MIQESISGNVLLIDSALPGFESSMCGDDSTPVANRAIVFPKMGFSFSVKEAGKRVAIEYHAVVPRENPHILLLSNNCDLDAQRRVIWMTLVGAVNLRSRPRCEEPSTLRAVRAYRDVVRRKASRSAMFC